VVADAAIPGFTLDLEDLVDPLDRLVRKLISTFARIDELAPGVGPAPDPRDRIGESAVAVVPVALQTTASTFEHRSRSVSIPGTCDIEDVAVLIARPDMDLLLALVQTVALDR
jgi:hypothetical protein